jgi:hypothetical protein
MYLWGWKQQQQQQQQQQQHCVRSYLHHVTFKAHDYTHDLSIQKETLFENQYDVE